jgi:hypothetical protein
LIDAQLDDVVVGVERRTVQRIGHVRRRLGADAPEGAVKVKVRGMYKPE